MGRADSGAVRVSHDWVWDRFHNIGRGISLLSLAGSHINLNHLGVIATVNQGQINRGDIGREAVRA